MEDLVASYQGLTHVPNVENVYAARVIGGRSSYRIAKDCESNPAVLVTYRESGRPIHPIELRNVVFRPRCRCKVNVEGGLERDEIVALIKCTTTDLSLREFFLRSVSGILDGLPDTPDEGDIVGAVERVVELFRALESPGLSSLEGAWCELLVIYQAAGIRQAAAAWHPTPGDLHDFVAGSQRLEVKATMGPQRVHHFRLEQLLTQGDSDVIVASFLLEEDGSGVSLAELWDDLCSREELTGTLRERMSKILVLSLGRDWRRARQVAFDPDQAVRDLQLYDVRDIPRVDSEVPVGVTEVRFKSEVSDVPALRREEVAERGGLWEALFR